MLRRRQFQRILLIKPSAVGDVIHALPVVAKLRRRYPAARIDWVLTPAIAELIGHHPALSNVVLFDRGITGGITAPARQWRDWLAGLGKMLADLWRTRYDLVGKCWPTCGGRATTWSSICTASSAPPF
jgi:ADP-heptose:LPS heptosyltransferase